MSVLWATQALPTGVTSLLPVFLGPLLGIMSSADISALYMSVSVNMHALGDNVLSGNTSFLCLTMRAGVHMNSNLCAAAETRGTVKCALCL